MVSQTFLINLNGSQNKMKRNEYVKVTCSKEEGLTGVKRCELRVKMPYIRE